MVSGGYYGNVKGLTKKTVAYLAGDINGGSFFRIAHSGEMSLPYTAPRPFMNRLFTGQQGAYDAEKKLLEELAAFVEQFPAATGRLRLVIDHPEGKGACDACRIVIREFMQKYPNITIETIPPM